MNADVERETIERRFIAAVIKDGTGERLEECRKLPPDIFDTPACARAWRALTQAATYIEGAGHTDVLPFFANPTIGENYAVDRQEVFIVWLRQIGLASVDAWRASLPTGSKDKLRARLRGRQFNFSTPPPEPVPRFLINARAVCTPGNLTNLIAQAKAGKSALTGAMLAAAICAEFGSDDRDTLGVTATAPGKLRLVHVDTEQSPFDHDQHVRRALRRAGVEQPPAWLMSYGLAGFSADELRQVLRLTLEDAHAAGGVFAVVIDGTADLVNDVNDPAECNAFVAELHDLAIRHACPIVNVVHENPGQDGGKMRGHLGSQLERKAESNLRLRKSDEITVVFSEKMRRAPILERDGPRFRWSDEAGMHVSVETAGAARESRKVAELRELAAEVFDGGLLTYTEARQRVEHARSCSRATAERRLDAMRLAGVVRPAGGGKYAVAV